MSKAWAGGQGDRDGDRQTEGQSERDTETDERDTEIESENNRVRQRQRDRDRGTERETDRDRGTEMETETERYRDREIQTESERSRVRQRTEIETEAETESERQKDRDGDRARNRVKERYRQRQRVGDRDRETERQRQTDRDREETGGREGSHRRSQLQGEQRGGTPPTERSHCRRRHTYLLLVEASGQPGSPLSTPTPLTSPPRNKSGAAGLAAAFIGGRCLQERPGGQGSQCPGWGRGSARSAPVTQRAGLQGTAQPPKAPWWGGVGVGVG